VFGGDGRYHNVPVEWVEYFDVTADSTLYVHDDASSVTSGVGAEAEDQTPAWREQVERLRGAGGRVVRRRWLYAGW
jgi:hypothetical protein